MIKKLKLEKNLKLYSVDNGFIIVYEIYKDSFRAYCEDDDYNSLYLPNDGFLNNSNFDVIVNLEDVESKEIQFIEEYLIRYHFLNEFNENWYYDLKEEIENIQEKKKLDYKKLFSILVDGFLKEENNRKYFDEFKNNMNQKYFDNKLSEIEIFDILLDIMEFDELNMNISSNLFLDTSVHYGCDCGCGGDMLEGDDYYEKEADKLLKQRKKIYDKLMKLLNKKRD